MDLRAQNSCSTMFYPGTRELAWTSLCSDKCVFAHPRGVSLRSTYADKNVGCAIPFRRMPALSQHASVRINQVVAEKLGRPRQSNPSATLTQRAHSPTCRSRPEATKTGFYACFSFSGGKKAYSVSVRFGTQFGWNPPAQLSALQTRARSLSSTSRVGIRVDKCRGPRA
jgi:hypothetical protein